MKKCYRSEFYIFVRKYKNYINAYKSFYTTYNEKNIQTIINLINLLEDYILEHFEELGIFDKRDFNKYYEERNIIVKTWV